VPAPIFAGVVVGLILLGFLPTPGVTKFLIPDYLLALREYGEPMRKLEHDRADIEVKISAVTSKLVRLANDAALAAEPDQKKKLAAEAALVSHDKSVLEEQRNNLIAIRTEMERKLDSSAADSTNLSLVARALALGAIGALLSIFAKYLAAPSGNGLLGDKNSVRRMWASMAMGAIVAVVAIGLFYTGFISIFSGSEKTTGTPDFWKVTILSLLAGAFADRLFQAAAYRMEKYVGQFEVAARPSANRGVVRSRNRSEKT
jgi:hypothetical protein